MASYTSRLFIRLHRMSKKMVADGLGEQRVYRVYSESKDKHGLFEIYKTLLKFSEHEGFMTWKQLKKLLDKRLKGENFNFTPH